MKISPHSIREKKKNIGSKRQNVASNGNGNGNVLEKKEEKKKGKNLFSQELKKNSCSYKSL